MQTIDRQIVGAVIIVLLINIVWLARDLLPAGQSPAGAALYSEQKKGYRTIELTGDARSAGIYFVPPGTRLAGFFEMAGIVKTGDFSKKELARVLESGDVVRLDQGVNMANHVVPGALGSSKRYILDLPINVNRAKADDLMVVPGIGEKTAEAIVETRKELGGFKTMEDLLQVRGIGPKKLETLRKYFCLSDSRISQR